VCKLPCSNLSIKENNEINTKEISNILLNNNQIEKNIKIDTIDIIKQLKSIIR
jgi:hypothetical protein